MRNGELELDRIVSFDSQGALCLEKRCGCEKLYRLDISVLEETTMSKRGRKRRDRRKHGANHGKRPNA